jgi:hypothetical protein
MALQVEDSLSGNVAEFGGFDRLEGVFARTKAGKAPAAAVGVSRVNGRELIPPTTIYVDWSVHF